MSTLFETKLSQLIAEAVESLTPADRLERVAWCVATGVHGAQFFQEGDSIRLVWGGRDLCIVEAALLTDDLIDELPPGEWISTEAPDTVPDAWGNELG
jgi:hypothetical protein